MDRRTFLAAGLFACVRPSHANFGTPSSATDRLISAWATGMPGQRTYAAGRVVATAPSVTLPARAHAIVADPRDPECAYVCARRPGEYLWRIDVARGKAIARADADDAFRFEGHAVIDASRGLVYATESELDNGTGQIGVYDAASLRKRATWSSGGLGPHEIIWHRADVVAVAHGGFLTLPETGRVERNSTHMSPSLTFIDVASGKVIASHALPDRTMGIRHAAVAGDGALGIALQNEGQQARSVFACFADGRWDLPIADPVADGTAKGYGACVAAVVDGFAVACTKGSQIALYGADGARHRAISMRSPSGLVSEGRWLFASNEFGELIAIDTQRHAVTLRRTDRRSWDNHLALLAG